LLVAGFSLLSQVEQPETEPGGAAGDDAARPCWRPEAHAGGESVILLGCGRQRRSSLMALDRILVRTRESPLHSVIPLVAPTQEQRLPAHGHPTQTRPSKRRTVLAIAGTLAIVLAAVLLLLLPNPPSTPPPSKHRRPSAPKPIPPPQPQLFSPNSIWNRPLPANAAIDPSSTQLVAHLVKEVNAEESAHLGPWIATRKASTPIYIVPANEPTVHVALIDPGLAWRASLARAFEKVPIPSDAEPARGPDGHMTIWQPSTNKLWEFFHAKRTAHGWQAAWGGAMRDVSHNPGYYTPAAWPGAQYNWGATATSFPVAAGVILLSQIRAGAIPHALALNIPAPREGVLATPAERSDGAGHLPDAIPEGAHLRINPHLNLSRIPMPPLTRLMAVAAQRYGLIVRDRAPGISLFIEDPDQYGGRKLISGKHGIYHGLNPEELLARFPWRYLEVLHMNLRPAALSTRFLKHH
jgi:hypothetical protein